MEAPVTIRKAVPEDLDEILSIYKKARRFMRQNGNPTQWNGGYPSQELIVSDIAQGNCHICLSDNKIVGVFTFIIGEDPTYQFIENGCWHWELPYGTIHRVASSGDTNGIAAACFSYCEKQIGHLRIDTHADNASMLAALQQFGFRRTGTIYVADGTPRQAFDYLRKEQSK